jgi:DHA2 family multidrug resistance protein
MMPFVGTMLKKGFPPQIMASIGFALFFVATWMLSQSTLASGPDDFFWPLIVRGIGLSFLFVPLTTMALSSLEGKDVPQGTGLNNMMRQLGGSFGIALMTTFISQRVMLHRVNLLSYLNPFNPTFTERIGMYTKAFISKGFSFMQAEQMANKAIDGMLMKQSMLMAYMDAFVVVGFFFIACIPIVLIFQRQRIKGPVVLDAH